MSVIEFVTIPVVIFVLAAVLVLGEECVHVWLWTRQKSNVRDGEAFKP